jgi:O-antigen/teichoic acid export membrane protein
MRFAISSREIRIWQVLVAYFLMQGLSIFYTAYLGGIKRFDIIARLNLTSSLVLLVVTTLGTVAYGTTGAVFGYFAGALPIAVLSLRLLWLPSGHERELENSLRNRCLKYAVFTWFAAIVTAIVWSRIEVFFLERYWNVHTVAMFTIGLTLSYLATQGPLLLTGPLMPHFASLVGARNHDMIRSSYARFTRLLAAMLFPMCFGLASITPALLPLLYGKSFAPAVPAAMVLIVISALSFANVGSALIYGMEKSFFIAVGGAAGAVLSLTSCMLIIPRWGTLGAVCCRAGVQTSMILLGLWYIQTRLLVPVPFRSLGKIILAASVSAIPSYLIVRHYTSVFGIGLAIPIAICVYVAAARALHILQLGDVELFESAFYGVHPFLQKNVLQAVRWLSVGA